jgi:nitroimidazol reductase NimA-like FMN-containing flavoprotein (pyridoxamine 5'-phosphate oxidase superfamily)
MTPGPAPSPDGVLAQLDRQTCLALLASRPVGRLVFTHYALPDVIPVNYRMDGESLLIRLGRGSLAATAILDAIVAFEVDDIDLDSRTGWSVTVVGRAHEVTERGQLRRAQELGLSSWVGDARDYYVSIAAQKVTGRRLFHAADAGHSDEGGDALAQGA